MPPAPGMTPSRISGWPTRDVSRADAQVARERELAAAAERVAADRGDHRARDRRDRVERGAERVGRRARAGSGRCNSLMSAPAANAFSLPATTTAFTDASRAERERGVAELAEQRDRQRIHRRTVEAQQRDPAVVVLGQHEIGHDTNED